MDVVLKRIAGEPARIEFRNHTALGQAVARRMLAAQAGIPTFLVSVLEKQEFWEYTGTEHPEPEQRLGLTTADNRALYIRIAAYAAIGAAANKDIEMLLKLATHSYGLVARAAVIRLIRMSGSGAFKRLIDMMKGDQSERQARSFAGALRDAEIEHYGVANVW